MPEQTAPFDQRLIWFLDANREGMLQLLRANQANPAQPIDLSLALETLKVGAETMCRFVEKGVAEAEKERLWAERDKIKAETEKTRVEMEKINAETERDRMKQGKDMLKTQKE